MEVEEDFGDSSDEVLIMEKKSILTLVEIDEIEVEEEHSVICRQGRWWYSGYG